MDNIAQEEDPASKKGVLPIHGNSSTFNINTLLYNNILESDYFKALYQLRTYHETIDEIYTSVSHVEPWQTGTTRVPSTAFCLLLKFFLMRLTEKQMKGLLNTGDSPYVRAIGFLYLRYACPPKDLWGWFEPYLEDDEEFCPSSDRSVSMTMGKYLIKLLTDMHYYNTQLPRIPVPTERKFKVLLLMLGEKQKRREANLRDEDRGKFCKGAKVMAIYADEENEPAWYEAVIDSRDREGESEGGGGHRYWVTFTEYGNTESVDLGDIKLQDDESKDRDRSRSGSRGRGNGEDGDLLKRVLDQERQGSVAVGKNYGSRPVSYKSSLSLQLDRYTVRQKSPSRSTAGDRDRDRGRDRRSRSRDRDRERESRYRDRSRDRDRDYRRDRSRERDRRDRDRDRSKSEREKQANSSMTTSTRSSAAQNDRLKKLRETYGDASANVS